MLENLYQDIILEHSKHPKHFGLPQNVSRQKQLTNRTCGDRFTLALFITNETITDIGFIGSGCAIATASASLMTDIIKESSTKKATDLARAMHRFIVQDGDLPHIRLAPFAGVIHYPSRHDCALLVWSGLTALLENPPEATANRNEQLRENIITTLRTIYDPEVPINIYDLGFIYKIEVEQNGSVAIIMTLTTPQCPVAETLPREVQRRVATVQGVKDVHVTLTFDPPWSKQKMSPDARLALGM